MSDGVITAALQSSPVVGITITIVWRLLRRESSSNTTHKEARDEWKVRETELKAEIRAQEKTIDAELEKRRLVEEQFAEYRRSHPQ